MITISEQQLLQSYVTLKVCFLISLRLKTAIVSVFRVQKIFLLQCNVTHKDCSSDEKISWQSGARKNPEITEGLAAFSSALGNSFPMHV